MKEKRFTEFTVWKVESPNSRVLTPEGLALLLVADVMADGGIVVEDSSLTGVHERGRGHLEGAKPE